MTIDDIYFAAINGEAQKLEQMLAQKQIDLNQMIDGGVNDGVRSRFPVLFSVCSTMHQNNKIHESTLDLLLQYGANINFTVELKAKHYTYNIPLAVYLIRNWKNARLLEYYLKHGGDPDAQQSERYSDGHSELYSLLYFAICSWQGLEAMELLLRYKANPNKLIMNFPADRRVNQLLPPLFYALIDQKSFEKTKLLFAYRADPGVRLDTGFGYPRQFQFANYVQRFYPSFVSSFERARVDALLTAIASPSASSAPKPAPQPAKEPKEEKPMTGSELSAFKEQVADLIRFDHQKRAPYHQAVANTAVKEGSLFTLRKRKQEAQEARDLADSIQKERAAMAQKLSATVTRRKVKANCWWKSFNGLTQLPEDRGDVLVWMPFSRVIERGSTLSLSPMFRLERMHFDAAGLHALLDAADCEVLYRTARDGGFSVAELCLFSTDMQDGAPGEIPDQSGEELRLRQQVKALYDSEEPERYLFENMSADLFAAYRLLRAGKQGLYAQKLQRLKEMRIDAVEDATRYLTPVGIIAFDAEQKVAAIALYKQIGCTECYDADERRMLSAMRRGVSSLDRAKVRRTVLSQLRHIPMPYFDPIAPPVAGVDGETHIRLLYAAYGEGKVDALQNHAAAQLNEVGQQVEVMEL